MARIPDSFLHCIVYLYGSEVDAEDGTRAGGSGFLVGVPTQGLRQNFVMLYVVSNKHVVRNSTVIRMNTIDGRKNIIPTNRSDWTHHPDGDDLTACLISFDPMQYKFNYVGRQSFLTKQIISEFAIGPGDDVFTVGRFINHEGRQQNLPTARFGNIGQMPDEKIKQDNGYEQESFLVDIRSIGGYSGSPVFVQIPLFSERSSLVKNWAPVSIFDQGPFGFLRSHGPWLLGVDWGHLNSWEPVRRDNGEPINPNPKAMQVRLNTGMSAVVPAWKLAELLDSGPLAQSREEIITKIMEDEAQNPPKSTTDAA